jgi:fibronectin type 3 domain-containing protein
MGMMASSTQVLVSVNPAGLDTGPYTATVTITTADGESIQIPVTLTVMSATSSGGSGPTDLAWDPSIPTGVAGYYLYIGTASGIYSFTIDVGMVTSYTLNNLEVGNTYYLAVTAYDSSGIESDFSNEVSKSIY